MLKFSIERSKGSKNHVDIKFDVDGDFTEICNDTAEALHSIWEVFYKESPIKAKLFAEFVSDSDVLNEIFEEHNEDKEEEEPDDALEAMHKMEKAIANFMEAIRK